MLSFTIILGCLAGLLILAVLAVGIAMLMSSSGRDQVSPAREGWIHRRSERDEEGW